MTAATAAATATCLTLGRASHLATATAGTTTASGLAAATAARATTATIRGTCRSSGSMFVATARCLAAAAARTTAAATLPFTRLGDRRAIGCGRRNKRPQRILLRRRQMRMRRHPCPTVGHDRLKLFFVQPCPGANKVGRRVSLKRMATRTIRPKQRLAGG